MALKFGLAIPSNEARRVARLAQAAEDAGWDCIFLGDYIWCEDPMIALAAAAMTTRRIKLGTMVIPVPLRDPWKLASESLALDRLSGGRLILGLGTGAVWMGWQCAPDAVKEPRARAEMLDETIDILTLLYRGKPFDYEGKHYRLRLTQMDEMHYPAKPIQQPRIPLWAPLIWPKKGSMARILKCDGLFPETRGPDGQARETTPDDLRAMKDFIAANRSLDTPFDIVASGKTAGMSAARRQDIFTSWAEAGATWWIEGLWGEAEEAAAERIRQGPLGN